MLPKNVPILVLDEAASADSEVELAIQEQLLGLMDKTVITIAHRLPAIACMDPLLVLSEGVSP